MKYYKEVLKTRASEIIDRMLAAYGVNEDKLLGDKLGKSKQSVRQARTKGVPADWVLQVASETGAYIEWIMAETEEGAPIRKSGDDTRSTITTLFTNKNMQQLAEWISEQNDGIDYWAAVTAKFAHDFPEFREWLKKRQGHTLTHSTPGVNDKHGS